MSFSSTTYSSSQPTRYRFKPDEHITAYELAQIVPILIAAGASSKNIYSIAKDMAIPAELNSFVEDLPDEVKRHFS